MQPLGQRHADRVGEPLPQRTGRRFDARRMAVFGMAGGLGAELAEVAQLVHRHTRIAGEVQQGVEQHRAVSGRQHEAVAIRPFGRRGIELQELGEQHRRNVGHAHRHAGMPGFGLLDGVHGQCPDGVGHVLVRHLAVYAHLHRRICHARPHAEPSHEKANAGAALAGPALDVYPCSDRLQRQCTAGLGRSCYRLALIGSYAVQSKVPWSRSSTACFQPFSSARRLKFSPSRVCRVMPSNTVAIICVVCSPILLSA